MIVQDNNQVYQNSIDSLSQNDDEEWQNVSYADIDLDGMKDPFGNKFKNTIKDYKSLSQFAS